MHRELAQRVSNPLNLTAEIDALRHELARLADEVPDDLDSYALKWPRMPFGFYRRLRWLASLLLRALETLGVLPRRPWPASLKHADSNPRARAYLIWAVGVDPDTLRAACGGIATWQKSMPEFAPVLVTDVAEFSFFSRLGWLVEFLPVIVGQGERFESRKARFVARTYRGAPVLPWRAGLSTDSWTADDISAVLHAQVAAQR